jgi:hypothetical protein
MYLNVFFSIYRTSLGEKSGVMNDEKEKKKDR